MKIIFGNAGHAGHGGHSGHVATKKIVSSHTSRNSHGPLWSQSQSSQDSLPTQEDHSLKYMVGIGAIFTALGAGLYLHKLGNKPPKA